MCLFSTVNNILIITEKNLRKTSKSLTFAQQILYTFVDVCHPFLFFCMRGSVDGKRFGCRTNQPAIFVFYTFQRYSLVRLIRFKKKLRILTSIIFESLQLYFFQRYNVLFVVFFFTDYDVAVDENVVEQKELTGFCPFAAHLGKDTLADKNPTWNRQRLIREGAYSCSHREKQLNNWNLPVRSCRSSSPP